MSWVAASPKRRPDHPDIHGHAARAELRTPFSDLVKRPGVLAREQSNHAVRRHARRVAGGIDVAWPLERADRAAAAGADAAGRRRRAARRAAPPAPSTGRPPAADPDRQLPPEPPVAPPAASRAVPRRFEARSFPSRRARGCGVNVNLPPATQYAYGVVLVGRDRVAGGAVVAARRRGRGHRRQSATLLDRGRARAATAGAGRAR